MSLSAVFNYMANQAVDCRNMVVTVVWHTHTTVWLLRNYSQRILTYYTRILLLVVKYVQHAYFIIGPNVRSHYAAQYVGHADQQYAVHTLN